MKCEQPVLQEALLAQARGGAPHSPELVAHLASCADCQGAVAFLAQAREHQAPELGDEELLRLRLRVLPRLNRKAMAPRKLGFGLAFAISAGTAVSLAAAGSYLAWRAPASELVEVPRQPLAEAAPGRQSLKPRAPVADAETPVVPESPAAPSVQAEAPRAPTPSTKPAPSGLWSDAAAALKSDNLPGAERALGKLASDPDQVTRDSAQLALVEIWIRQQQLPRARTALTRLARTGATPALRERAATLLAGLPR